MGIFETLLLVGFIMALLFGGYVAFAGPSVGKAANRRLQAVRYRHSESTDAKVESQLKKAIAARKPKLHKVAGSTSRLDALAIRLDRTGKNWTLSQYIYASIGIALFVAVVIYLRSGALLLSLGVGVLIVFRALSLTGPSINVQISSMRNARMASSCWSAVCVLVCR